MNKGPSNEEIARRIKEKLDNKNKKIAELQKIVTDLEKNLARAQEEIEKRDRLFDMLSGLLKED